MARFQPRTPADLKMLQARICPECGASLQAGMTACPVCRLDFGEHAAVLAPPPVAPAPKTAPGGVAPGVLAPRTSGKPLSTQDIDELERGLAARALPVSAACAPDVVSSTTAGIGVGLAQAMVVMANAALVDDPEVLAGRPAPSSHIPLAVAHDAKSAAALVDAAEPAPRLAPVASAPPAPHRVAQHAPAAKAFDPDATLVHDARAIAATIEQVRAAKGSVISARGGAAALDD